MTNTAPARQKVWVRCPDCDGEGSVEGIDFAYTVHAAIGRSRCEACEGQGERRMFVDEEDGQ